MPSADVPSGSAGGSSPPSRYSSSLPYPSTTTIPRFGLHVNGHPDRGHDGSPFEQKLSAKPGERSERVQAPDRSSLLPSGQTQLTLPPSGKRRHSDAFDELREIKRQRMEAKILIKDSNRTPASASDQFSRKLPPAVAVTPVRHGVPRMTLSADVLGLSSRRRMAVKTLTRADDKAPGNVEAQTPTSVKLVIKAKQLPPPKPTPAAYAVNSFTEKAEQLKQTTAKPTDSLGHPENLEPLQISPCGAISTVQVNNSSTTSLKLGSITVDTVDDISHLKTDTNGRRFDEWQDSSGKWWKTKDGALFPVGYQWGAAFPSRPWICPLRKCRLVYMQAQGLGNHFNRAHIGSLLNDDGDGYFSEVGHYNAEYQTGQGKYKNTPLVVSQDRVGANAPQPAEPSIPAGSNPKGQKGAPQVKKIVVRNTPTSLPSLEASAPTLSAPLSAHGASSIPARSDPDALWAYIRPFQGTYTEAPPSIQEWLKLPRVRDMKWNREWIKKYPFSVLGPSDLISVVIYLTGTPAPVPCTRCGKASGPFDGCIMVSDDTPGTLREQVFACACCHYHNRPNSCSHKHMGRQRAGLDQALPTAGKSYDTPPATARRRNLVVTLTSKKLKGLDVSTAKPLPKKPTQIQNTTQSGLPSPKGCAATPRAVSKDFGTLASTRSRRAGATSSRLGTSGNKSHSNAPVGVVQKQIESTSRSQRAQRRKEAANAGLSNLHSSQPRDDIITRLVAMADLPTELGPLERLQVEEWEAAPGLLFSRQVPKDGSRSEVLAVSKPFVASCNPLNPWPDFSMHVIVIPGPGQHFFYPLNDRPRVVTVFAGKLKVKFEEEDEFQIGAMGLFRVEKGKSCLVTNMLYRDVPIQIVHVGGGRN